MSTLESGVAEGCYSNLRSSGSGMAQNLDPSSPGAHWFALWTRSRQEKVAATMLESLGVQHFLPLKSELKQWSDRKQTVTTPLFAGYLFIRMDLLQDNRLQILKVPGVAGLVGNRNGPLPIPDLQIDSIRVVLGSRADCLVLPLLREGERVRVVRGVLSGVEGTLVRHQSASRLVISVELIHQSLAVTVSPRDVEFLDRQVA